MCFLFRTLCVGPAAAGSALVNHTQVALMWVVPGPDAEVAAVKRMHTQCGWMMEKQEKSLKQEEACAKSGEQGRAIHKV